MKRLFSQAAAPVALPHRHLALTALVRSSLVTASLAALALAPTVATAQGAPPAAAGAQPVDPASAPAPLAPAPVGVTAAPFDQPANPAPPSEEPAPLIWRGTTFSWTHSVSTTTVGVGHDFIGDEEDSYNWDFVLAPQIFLLDLPNDKIFATAEAGVSVEWTDSGSTTTKHEPQFRDTQLGIAYQRNIFTTEDKEWSTKGTARLRYSIPTSRISIAQGRYGVISAGVSASQVLRLLGSKADGLNNLTVLAGLTYSHLFSRAFNPTNPDLERTRQNASGASIFSDQLSFRSFDIDRLIPSVTFILPLYKDLSLTTAFRLVGRFRHDFAGSDCEVIVQGECQKATRLEDRATYLTDSTFDISLSQPIYDMFQLNLGYNNETLTIGEDGKNRNIFYSPSAQFYLDIVANIDVLYEKASGRSEVNLPPGPRNALTAANEYGQPAF